MKRMFVLSLIAGLTILTLGTSASAQALAQKPMFATVACKGNTSACIKLDLYQKMASTSGTAGEANAQASSGASARNNPVTARRARATGGVENNPADDSGGAALQTFRKNADRQAKLIAKNQRQQGVLQPGANQHPRSAQAAPVRNRLERRGGDPTNNNPFSSSRATAQPRTQNSDRATTRPRQLLENNRMLQSIRSREITRHRPTDF